MVELDEGMTGEGRGCPRCVPPAVTATDGSSGDIISVRQRVLMPSQVHPVVRRELCLSLP